MKGKRRHGGICMFRNVYIWLEMVLGYQTHCGMVPFSALCIIWCWSERKLVGKRQRELGTKVYSSRPWDWYLPQTAIGKLHIVFSEGMNWLLATGLGCRNATWRLRSAVVTRNWRESSGFYYSYKLSFTEHRTSNNYSFHVVYLSCIRWRLNEIARSTPVF